MPRIRGASTRTVRDLVDTLATRLEALEAPQREAGELVSALLDMPRHWPTFRPDDRVGGDTWNRACLAAARRAEGAPLAYAVGRASFRHLTLDVDERVLIPRPETELLVDLVLERCRRGGTVVDVGTGSGAIAIALACEGDFDHVVATDISADALDVARRNAARHADDMDTTLTLLQCDLLPPPASRRPLAAVVSNPPYVSFGEILELPRSVRDWEPPVALYSGADGLAHTTRLVRHAAERLAPGGLLALESDARRASLVAELVATDGRYANVEVRLDLAARERFVLATRMEQP